MIFLTSFIYVLLSSVILLVWWLLAGWPDFSRKALIGTIAANVLLWVLIYIVLHIRKAAYEDFEQEDEHKGQKRIGNKAGKNKPGQTPPNTGPTREDDQTQDRKLRDFLNVHGCAWLNTCGILLIAAGFAALLLREAMPFPCWFLFIAIVAALHDVIGKTDLVRWRKSFPKNLKILPAPKFALPTMEDIKTQPAGPSKLATFAWSYKGVLRTDSFEKAVYLSKDEYEQYSDKTTHPRYDRRPVQYYANYVWEPLQAGVSSVGQMARILRDLSEDNDRNFSPDEEVMNCVSFVRAIDYVHDDVLFGVDDYATYPIEILWKKGGDCEDHGILAASILRALGHDVILIWVGFEDCGHIAIGYHVPFNEGHISVNCDEKNYAYVETVPTQDHEGIGVMPAGWAANIKQEPVAIPIRPYNSREENHE